MEAMGRELGQDEELFVVVCTEMHLAYGPFLGLDLAIAASKQIGKASKCSYLPVPMVPMKQTVRTIQGSAGEAHTGKEPGGYL